jgi:actin-related protein 8
MFSNRDKLVGRRKLLDRCYDIYDGSPNDPYSTAQATALQYAGENIPSAVIQQTEPTSITVSTSTPSKEKPQPFNLLSRLNEVAESTPRSSTANTPAPEGSPGPTGRTSPVPGASADGAPAAQPNATDPTADRIRAAEERDRILPVMPIDLAILTSIRNGARGDDRKMRDYFGGIMVVGGGAKIPGFNSFLEVKLREMLPGYTKEILIGQPPRELDQQLVVWKGGSVFGRLSSSGNDSWVYKKEYEMLGAKLLAQKCMWSW